MCDTKFNMIRRYLLVYNEKLDTYQVRNSLVVFGACKRMRESWWERTVRLLWAQPTHLADCGSEATGKCGRRLERASCSKAAIGETTGAPLPDTTVRCRWT